MKSYGRINKFWDDAKFRALIGDTLQMAGERGVPLAVYQDDDGNIVVSRAPRRLVLHVRVRCSRAQERKYGGMQDGAGWSHAVRTLHDRADDPDRTRCPDKGDIRVRRIGPVRDCRNVCAVPPNAPKGWPGYAENRSSRA